MSDINASGAGPTHAHGSGGGTAQAHTSGRAYVITWLALLALTATSFGVSTLELGGWDTLAALTIASTKGFLVALVFMHLREARFVTRMVLVFALFFVALLCGLMVADVARRTTFPPAARPAARSQLVEERSEPQAGPRRPEAVPRRRRVP